MKLLKLLSIIILLHVTGLVKGQQAEIPQLIKWSKDRPLTWDDFKALPDRDSPHDAMTNCRVYYRYTVKHVDTSYVLTFNITSGFNPQASWGVRRMENEDILKHEQLHFDIHEMYTRKLAAAFKSATYTANYREEVKAIFQQVMDQYHAAQTKYDMQTEHSVSQKLQLYWQDYIHHQLDSTSADY